MPVTNSVAFANNRGGSGKTFLVFQLACEAARARPSSKVLVIDFSLYSETSGLLMGGLARADPLAQTKGLAITVRSRSRCLLNFSSSDVPHMIGGYVLGISRTKLFDLLCLASVL